MLLPNLPRTFGLLPISMFVALLTAITPAFAQGSAAPAASGSPAPPASSSESPAIAPAPTDAAAAPAAPPAQTAPSTVAVAPYGAWDGNAYGRPPPSVLGAPPPPELEPPAYSRRAVELLPELMLGFPECHDGSFSNPRCDDLGGGLGLGVGGLWRVSPYFAFGGTLDALAFRFRPPAQAALSNTRAAGFFAGILGRVYFMDSGALDPYVELALGGGAIGTNAVEANNQQYQESSAGGSVRVGGGLEFFLSSRLRLGPALDLTRFSAKHVRRCDAQNQCVDLDPNLYAHGVGFFTLSCRLTILVGPKL
ncbi:MAG TPA: hypothetical protein VGM29_12030 [Polyangiaceae bacterium]